MRIMTNAAVYLKMDETQKNQTVRCYECGACGTVGYVNWGWECPICAPKVRADPCRLSYPTVIGHGMGRVFKQSKRLRFMRGTLKYHKNKWGFHPKLNRKLWGWEDANEAFLKDPRENAKKLRERADQLRLTVDQVCDSTVEWNFPHHK